MLLAIDAGNTDTLFALFNSDGDILERWRLSTSIRRTSDEYAVYARHFLERGGYAIKDVKGVAISCVVPAALHALERCAMRDFGLTSAPVIMGRAGVRHTLNICLDYPEEIGADRLVNTFAVHEERPRDALVIDFGTATTFDVINKDGSYLGGVIAPGVHMSMQSLHKAAARLPEVAFAKPEKVIGTNTISALTSGMFYGYLGLTEGLIEQIRLERGLEEMEVIATGGLAGKYAEASDKIHSYAPDLTINGLYRLYCLNRH